MYMLFTVETQLRGCPALHLLAFLPTTGFRPANVTEVRVLIVLCCSFANQRRYSLCQGIQFHCIPLTSAAVSIYRPSDTVERFIPCSIV